MRQLIRRCDPLPQTTHRATTDHLNSKISRQRSIQCSPGCRSRINCWWRDDVIKRAPHKTEMMEKHDGNMMFLLVSRVEVRKVTSPHHSTQIWCLELFTGRDELCPVLHVCHYLFTESASVSRCCSLFLWVLQLILLDHEEKRFFIRFMVFWELFFLSRWKQKKHVETDGWKLK